MIRHWSRAPGLAMRCFVLMAAAFLSVATVRGASAQGGAAAPVVEPAAKLSDDEIDALVARIALYPDPLLVVVLQASTLPLQVVEANRFLEKRAKDPAARPKDDWDSSITALLNYPSVAKMMSDDLDWTQDLGGAVLTQLVDVQDSVQQLRSELQAVGGLQSNDKQVIKIENAVIRIEPAQPNVIFVPTYDPAALLALSSAPPAPASAASSAPPAAASAAAPPPPAPAPAESAPAPAAAPAPYPAAAPGYAAPPPAYPYPAPYYPPPAPVAYSDPYPSFWTGAATFAGGAIMGGLIGYAIADDDDCCGDGDWNGGGSVDRNVNRNVNRNTNARDMQAQLQARGGAQNPAAARGAAATRANTAATRANTAATRADAAGAQPRRAAASAGATGGGAAGAQPRREASGSSAPTQRPQRSAAQASPQQASSGALGNVGSAREARNQSARGAQSRAAAQNRSTQAMPQRSAGAQQAASRPQPRQQQGGGAFASRGGGGGGGAFASRGGGGGGGAFASRGGGESTARAADRGARSRGGGGGGGGGRRR